MSEVEQGALSFKTRSGDSKGGDPTSRAAMERDERRRVSGSFGLRGKARIGEERRTTEQAGWTKTRSGE